MWREALQAIATMALFGALAGGGLAMAPRGSGGLAPLAPAAAPPPRAPYPVPPVVERSRRVPAPALGWQGPAPLEWLVDGYNVLNVAWLRGRSREGWWRAAARAELVADAASLDTGGAQVWIAFDGPRPAPDAPGAAGTGTIRVVFAPNADRWILERVRAAPQPQRLVVVTADRRLAARVRSRGARVWTPGAFAAEVQRSAPAARAGTSTQPGSDRAAATEAESRGGAAAPAQAPGVERS